MTAISLRPQWVNTSDDSMPPVICEINPIYINYHQTSNISHTLVGNKIVDHSDVVGASIAIAAPTTF